MSQPDNQSTSKKIPSLGLLSDPKTYLVFLDLSKWQLALFIMASALLLTFFQLALLQLRIMPQFTSVSQAETAELLTTLPNDFRLNWDGQTLSINPNLPTTVSFFESAQFDSPELPSSLAYFGPSLSNDQDVAALKNNSLFVLSANDLYVRDQGETVQSYSLTEILPADPFTINKNDISTFFDQQLQSIMQVVFIGLAFLTPFKVVGGLLSQWLFQWLLTYVILVVLYKLPLTGSQLARLLLPIVVVAALLDVIAKLIYGLNSFSLSGIAFWLLLFVIIRAFALRGSAHHSQQNQHK